MKKIDDEKITCASVYQLVLSGKRQKLVFMCTNAEYTMKMCNHARECFKETASLVGREITVNISCSGENEITLAYNKLYNFIRDKKDIHCCESMKHIQLLQKFQHSYREYDCSDSIAAGSLDELMKILKSVHSCAPINITINNTGIIGNNNTMGINTTDRKDAARQWVASNPPNNGEPSGKYFSRFQSSHIRVLDIKNFNKIVISQGYQIKKTAQFNVWTRSTL